MKNFLLKLERFDYPLVMDNPTLPFFPPGLSRVPFVFQLTFVSERVHRLPKTIMLVGAKLIVGCQLFHWLLFPQCLIRMDVIKNLRFAYKIPPVDPGAISFGLLHER